MLWFPRGHVPPVIGTTRKSIHLHPLQFLLFYMAAPRNVFLKSVLLKEVSGGLSSGTVSILCKLDAWPIPMTSLIMHSTFLYPQLVILAHSPHKFVIHSLIWTSPYLWRWLWTYALRVLQLVNCNIWVFGGSTFLFLCFGIRKTNSINFTY